MPLPTITAAGCLAISTQTLLGVCCCPPSSLLSAIIAAVCLPAAVERPDAAAADCPDAAGVLQVQEKCRTEVDEVLGGRHPAYADLGQLPYLTATMKESLRTHPPVIGVARML